MFRRPIAKSKSKSKTKQWPPLPFRLQKLPPEVLDEYATADFLHWKQVATLATVSRTLNALFQPLLQKPHLLQLTAEGNQPKVKEMLAEAKLSRGSERLRQLLTARYRFTDFSKRSFLTPLTPYQTAYFYKDWHMLELFSGSRLYLLALQEHEKISASLFAHARTNKTPILIREGKNYFVYGFDETRSGGVEENKWRIIPLAFSPEKKAAEKEHELLRALPFAGKQLVVCGQYLTPAVRKLLIQGHPPIEQFLSAEEQARQLALLRDNPIHYPLPLLRLPDTMDINRPSLLSLFNSLSIQSKNKPLLIKCGEELRFYCYDFNEEKWKLKALEPSELFSRLPFPSTPHLESSGFAVLPALNPAEFDQVLPQGQTLTYLLIQEADGVRPTALYRIDRSQFPCTITPVRFPINQNLHTFLRALFPEEENELYSDIVAFNEEQLIRVMQTTGYPVHVVLPESLTEAIYQELANHHAQGTEFGLHCDDRRLDEALQIHSSQFPVWDTDRIREYWITHVREAQIEAAAHVAHGYCRWDRSHESVPRYESEMTLPRDLHFYQTRDQATRGEWFPLREGQGLLTPLAIHRNAIAGNAGVILSPENQVSAPRAALDAAAIHQLCKASSACLVKVKETLPIPAPEPKPEQSKTPTPWPLTT